MLTLITLLLVAIAGETLRLALAGFVCGEAAAIVMKISQKRSLDSPQSWPRLHMEFPNVKALGEDDLLA